MKWAVERQSWTIGNWIKSMNVSHVMLAMIVEMMWVILRHLVYASGRKNLSSWYKRSDHDKIFKSIAAGSTVE